MGVGLASQIKEKEMKALVPIAIILIIIYWQQIVEFVLSVVMVLVLGLAVEALGTCLLYAAIGWFLAGLFLRR